MAIPEVPLDQLLDSQDPSIESSGVAEDIRSTTTHTKRLITAALPYINNVPHLGHLVGSHLPADIFTRWSKMRGHETTFIGGSDEYGTPSELAAEKLGIPHKEFCDKLHAIHAAIYEKLGISYDNYSRTSSAKHREIVEKLFNEIDENGFISREIVKMFYDPQAERFLADRYVEGTCPNCGFEGASGDQCEKCTALLVTEELIDPKSTLTGASPELRETEHLFLDLQALEDKLREWVNTQTSWRPQVKSIALKWLDEGLKKRSITRDLKHGIPVPMDGMSEKMLYVWFEAPIAYISFLAEIAEDWKSYWGEDAKESEVFHFLGKDNIPFHTIFWPAILMAAGNYRLPTHVAGMQYLNYEGEKFSKSKQRGVFCESLLDAELDLDLLRVYLALIIPEKNDAEFNWEEMMTLDNAMLVNKVSNLPYRIISFAKKRGIDQGITTPTEEEMTDLDNALLSNVQEKLKEYEDNMEAVQIRSAIRTVFEIASLANDYLDKAAPWTAVKDGNERRAQSIIYMCAHVIRSIACTLSPFAPNTAQRLWNQFDFKGDVNSPGTWNNIPELSTMPSVLDLKDPEMLFVRLTDETMSDIRSQLSKITPLEDFFK